VRTRNWKWKARFLSSGFGALAAAASSGEILTVVGDGNVLLTFDHAAQGTTFSSQGITGLQPGEQILAIDFRPASGRLFALGSSNRTYRIDPATGAAAAVGHGAMTPALAGWQFVYSGALDSKPRGSTSVTAAIRN
jgi:hypothetical protein